MLAIPAHYQSDSASLYVGNSARLLEQVPDAVASGFCIDPPYCSGGALPAITAADPQVKYCSNRNTVGKPSFSGDTRDQRSLFRWAERWLSECLRIAKPGAYLFLFTDWRQLPTFSDAIQAAGWTWRGIAAWDKGLGSRAPHKGYIRHQCEYILWGTNGRFNIPTDRGPFSGCFQFPVKPSDKHHITGKPTALLQELVRIVEPGGLIVDPFAGSATTGVACQLEGRRFLGFELSPKYADIAAARLASTTERPATVAELRQRKTTAQIAI